MDHYPEPPSELTWFECFVDPTVVSNAIFDPVKKKQLPRLCMQFTEKGFLAEKEKDKGKLAVEELQLFDRKAASMRLCAMATFAALDYDIDYIIDNISRNELLTLRVLADNFYKIYNERNLDATFGNWLFYRFVLSIDRRDRLPAPAPSATIPSTLSNGQLMPLDPALIRHEKVQRMILELRDHVPKARLFITELSEEPRDVVAPGIECFLKPFRELAPKAMTAALLGDRNVLIENPSPDFEVQNAILPAVDVANKCLSELVAFLFSCGDLLEAKKILLRVTKPSIEHPMVAINSEAFKAYSMMLNVKGAFIAPNGSTVMKPFVYDQKVLSDDASIYRKSEFYRYRGAEETTGQLKQAYLAENAAMSVVDGHPECIRDKLTTKAQKERFVKVLKKLLDGGVKYDRHRMQAIRGQLQYLCATTIELREMLESGGIDVTELRTYFERSPHIPIQPTPSMVSLNKLVKADDPFWTLMTSFDLEKLKVALTEIGAFWFPNTMHISEFLKDAVDPNIITPMQTLQRLLLAKLEQLSRLKHSDKFVKKLEEYFPEFGTSEAWGLKAAFESIHVHALCGNHQCNLPYERQLVEVSRDKLAYIFKPEFRPTENSAKMINQCLALMLNIGEAQTVLEKGGHISIDMFKSVPVARILGAYLSNLSDVTASKKCADGLWRTVTTKFNDAHNRPFRRTGDVAGDARILAGKKDLAMLFHLLELIREKHLLDFTLAFAVCFFNKLLSMQKKSSFKLHAKMLHLYSPDPTAVLRPKLDGQCIDDARQLLRTMCEKTYAVCRTDPDTIRTYADFLYFEKDWQGAGQKYMEYFCAHSPLLRLNTSDFTIFDDTLLHRLRICLAHSGYLTMSLLVCQFMKSNRSSEYQKAMKLLQKNETRDVGANCSEFITDTAVIEMLSAHYHANKMTKSLTTLYAGGSSLAANKNVSGAFAQQEVNRRAGKLLESIASIYFGMHT